MAAVQLRAVAKTYGGAPILRDINLDIADGEFVVFVGPSGCGKSTLLRAIAGLEEISAGELQIGGVRVNHLPPAQRGIAMVFQSYALYPHMSVFENMAFGLRLARVPRRQIEVDVRAAARILNIEDLLDRKPRALSGGQRQRVAIGRAIVRKPKVFLFDEPLSNLDPELRVRMRYEFARLHRELQATMIYVTHDQSEAMTLADRIVVLSTGQVEQVGEPMELYHRPANRFVAGFIGSPRMNFLPVSLHDASEGRARVRLASDVILDVAADAAHLTPGAALTVGIRPGDLGVDGGQNALEGRIDYVEQHGNLNFSYVLCPAIGPQGGLLTVELPRHGSLRAGDPLRLHLPAERCHLFDAEGRALRRPPIFATAVRSKEGPGRG
jgi:multiple sugar transport system ATP-binding protein